MNDDAGLGIITAILIVSSLLVGAAAATVIMNGSETFSEEDLEEMANEAVDEISTYIQIKDKIGRYDAVNEEQIIQKIAILIKPLFSVDIDVSTLTIKLCNGQQIRILYYNGQSEFINSYSLFGHQVWDEMANSSFGFIVINDKDESLIDYDTINDNTDLAYIVIKLPEEFTMKKGDTMTITLFPSTGITRTLDLEAPLPIKQVVSLS